MSGAPPVDDASPGGSSYAKAMLRAKRPRVALLVNAVSSVGNLGLTIAIARESSVAVVGQYAIAFAAYTLVAGLARAAVAESVLADPDRSEVCAGGLRRCVLLALAMVPLVAGAAAIFSNPYLAVVAATIPGLVVFDYVKVTQLAMGRPAVALRQEVAWTGPALLFCAATLVGWVSPLSGFIGWALAGSLLGLVSGRLLGFRLAPGWHGGRAEARIATFYGLDHLAGSGTAQLNFFALGAVAGAGSVGAVRGAGTVLSPLTLIISTIRPLAIPYLARARRGERSSELAAAGSASVLVTMVTLPIGLLALAIPDSVGTALLGATWVYATPLILPLALEVAVNGVAALAFAGHRARRAALRTLVIRLGLAPVRIGVVLLCAALWGAVGAAWGMFAVALLGAVVWWTSYAYTARAGRDAK